ncbi:beta-1,3-galactosyltransferase 1-like [Octopus vulgaris]|uniref:Hexosyltransferase n=1 Tax=Octopus vulgaris TaxID=6645 RepID=A0AA36B856_OCTVU|nr:beta-1,3-galactosyltransferase 1-like [Octopus vulgaris]
MKIVFRPQPSGSKVDPWYYHHHVPYQHNFKKVINEPTLCSQHEKVFLLYTVRTIYDHFDRREVLRNIFSNIPEDSCAKGVPIKHLFLFGKPNNSTIESLIQKESEMYHDILLEDFKESYVNVSIKAIMAWKYSVEFCANAEYVAVMNDEAFIDLNRIVSWLGHDLSKGKYEDHFALCYRIGDSPALHKHIKQFTYLDEEILYRGDFYPPYCHGFGYIAPINVINKLYLAALQNAYYMPTDVWIGVLAEMLNINIINHEHQYIFTGVLKHYASGKYQKSPIIVAICDFENIKSETGKLMRQLYQVIYN